MNSQTIGSRRQVWNGTAKKTPGGLTKSDLIMSHGRIVSKSKHFSAKKEMRLLKYGYGTKKGKFGFVKVGTKSHRKGRKMRGGHVNIGNSLSPNGIDGQGINNNTSYGSVNVQEAAGMAGGSYGSANWNNDNLIGGKRRRRRHRKMRGGTTSQRFNFSPADYDSTNVQFRAGSGN